MKLFKDLLHLPIMLKMILLKLLILIINWDPGIPVLWIIQAITLGLVITTTHNCYFHQLYRKIVNLGHNHDFHNQQ